MQLSRAPASLPRRCHCSALDCVIASRDGEAPRRHLTTTTTTVNRAEPPEGWLALTEACLSVEEQLRPSFAEVVKLLEAIAAALAPATGAAPSAPLVSAASLLALARGPPPPRVAAGVEAAAAAAVLGIVA